MSTKLVAVLALSKIIAYHITEWLDEHRELVVLAVFFFALALIMWTQMWGPEAPLCYQHPNASLDPVLYL